METHNSNSYTHSVDVLVVGSGPIGCTYARKLVEGGRSVLMVEAGVQERKRPGEHLKNAYKYQRDVNSFVNIIKGALDTLSVPTKDNPVVTLDPFGWQTDTKFVRNGQNPYQDPRKNLGASAATHAVGGMATHWTCAVPRQHPEIERSDLLTAEEYDRFYDEAEKLVKRNLTAFDNSIRNTIVKELIQNNIPKLSKLIQNLPLAVERRTDNTDFVTWTGSDTILGPLIDENSELSKRFEIWESHRCNRVFLNHSKTSVEYVEVEDLMKNQVHRVYANTFIICGGAVLTPQILFNSREEKLTPYALGRFLTEQTIAFCQIVLNQKSVDNIKTDPRWSQKVEAHKRKNGEDPLPIPYNDPDPQLYLPVTPDRPWHVQIHRDAFSYGEVAEAIDNRLVVDLRWFGMMQPRKENRVYFLLDGIRDKYGMPQPTFDVTMNLDEKETIHKMMNEMTEVASVLGGYLPGSEPQFMTPGLALHVQGTYRAGTNPDDSVVDKNSKFWGIDNLFLGGNGVLPTGNACNPTLTSIVFALKSCEYILQQPLFTPINEMVANGLQAPKFTELQKSGNFAAVTEGKRGIVVNFKEDETGVNITPTWTLGGWQMVYAELAPNARLNLDGEKDKYYVKVIVGCLPGIERGNVPPPNNKALNLLTEGVIQAGREGAILGIYVKTPQAPASITKMEGFTFGGPLSELINWQVMEKYKGERFNSKAFYNAHGIELWNKKKEYISYQQWWTSGKGVDCLLHNHAQDDFLEVHMYMWNGSGEGHVHMYHGEEYVQIVLKEGDEHPPFWLFDKKTGKPLRDGNRIRYWYHGSESGGSLKPTFTDPSGWSEGFDVWVVHEINPALATVPVRGRDF